jgi:hypothetical protein
VSLRPCVRWKFPNFSFLRVSEMFGCWSSEFFWKKQNFQTRKIFAKKFGKKFGNLSLEKSLYINQYCMSILKILKKLCKVWIFESKNPVFGLKSLEMFWKVQKSSEKFGKVQKVQKSLENSETGFSKCSEISEIIIFQTFPKLLKNDIKLELQKLQKTRSDLKTTRKFI